MKGNKHFKYLIVSIVALGFSIQSAAQLTVNSPYTRFGLGDLYRNESNISRSMAGVSFGVNSPNFINAKNPASYARIDTLSFVLDVGYSGFLLKSSTANASMNYNYFNLDYMRIGLPITNWWKASIGLSPYSLVGYNITSTSEVDSVGSVTSSYLGDGGINRFTFGNAFRITKDLYFGVNSSLLFGNINYKKMTEVPDDINTYAFRLVNSMNVKSLYFDFGLQYRIALDKEQNYQLTLGGVFSNQQKLKAYSSSLAETLIFSSTGYEYIKDTILNQDNGNGRITIPMYYGGGFYLTGSDKWSIGLDYSAQLWKNYEAFGKKDSLGNSMLVALGGTYKLGRAQLAAGFRYSNSLLMLNNETISELGMTFGLSVPLFIDKETGNYPALDFGAEIGRRGTKSNGLIQEDFLRFYLGLSIKSNWFKRPKYY